MRRLWSTSSLLLLALVAGCGPRLPPPPPGPPPPGPLTVAILPLANVTLSVDGPEMLRSKLITAIARHGYIVQSTRETDEHMREIGVTLGGQLPGVKIDELRRALKTDAAIGGTLLKHQNVVLGVANQQSLEAEIQLIDLTNGRRLWSSRRMVVESQNYAPHGSSGNGKTDAAVCLLSGICGLAGGMARNDFKIPSEKLSWLLTESIPRPGAGYGLPSPDSTPTTGAPVAKSDTGAWPANPSDSPQATPAPSATPAK